VAPGETAVIVGGVVAGQGRISLPVLIGLVWACAVAGDVTSFLLGRRLGRGFLLRHGARVKITEERLEQVEGFFERRGGTTIVVGRFIGFVRPIAPFVAGASRLPLARFLPYDVLGAGAWAATFCLLGYVFWRSFDRLTQWVSRGLAALGALVVLGIGVWFAARLIRDGALRARTRQWLEQQLERPALRPFAPGLRAGWSRVGRPLLHAGARPARWVWHRLTPGELGLELTTLLALTAVGAFTFVVLGGALDDHELLPFDQMSLDLSERLYTGMGEAVAAGVAALGSALACAVVVLTTAGWAGARRRWTDAIVLVAAFAATWLLAGVAQSAFDRPAPPDPARRHGRRRLSLGARGAGRRLDRVRGRARARRPPSRDALRRRHRRDGAGGRGGRRAGRPARLPPVRRGRRARARDGGVRVRGRCRARRRLRAPQCCVDVSNQTWTYVVAGTAVGLSLIAWAALVLVPAWTSFSKLWERLVAVVLSVYVLAAFALAGALLGGGFLWYFDQL
jgi:membrane protein DedA with SNARE-associated domain